jgi:hypothetical protein
VKLSIELTLIGGSSSVGKTTLADALADRCGAGVLHLDELVAMAGRTNSTIRFPAGIPDVWNRPVEGLRDGLIAKGEALTPLLHRVVSERLREGRRVVIEGEGIQPGHALQWADDRRVRAVFVVEEDEQRILDTLTVRGSSTPVPDTIRLKVARMNALYGSWLRTEAVRHGLRWLPSQPWATLLERFIGS